MEAAEETLTSYRDVTGLHRKLLPEDKEDKEDKQDKEDKEDQGQGTGTHSDESNYVDLDMKPETAAKTVKVTFTGEGNQLSVAKCDGTKPRERDRDRDRDRDGTPDTDPDPDPEPSGTEELRYTDMYLNSRTESDDGASAVLSDHTGGSDTVQDESHYITTHEIQLTELDHDVDYDLGRGTCWDFEDNNLVYSFVDYASFESDDTQEGTVGADGAVRGPTMQGPQADPGGTEPEDSDLCDSDKCGSSDESVCKTRSEAAGKIHLSIQTIPEPGHIFDCVTRAGDRGHFSFVSSGPRADRPQYFIPAPGRQHLATKLRRKDINEYSSGASSSFSELDDADKEVRNLTAKSFRSLACPYFDAINLSTSSESSMSEYGLNKWSAYVDWNYQNVSRRRGRSVIAHKTSHSSATVEMNKTLDGNRCGKTLTGMRAPQAKLYALNRRAPSQQSSSSSRNMELRDPVQPEQRGVTLNFHCNVEAPEGARRPKCSKKGRAGEVTGTLLARAGCEVQCHHADSSGDTHKRAVFASSLLKNVISKKMQFEQERKMERGEICDSYPALSSPSFQLKGDQGRGFQRQTSESGSGFTSAEDQQVEGSRPGSSEPADEQRGCRAPDDAEKSHPEPPKEPLSQSQSSAFNSVREDETKPTEEAEPVAVSETQGRAKPGLDTSSMLTKLLFVPSCQLSKEKDLVEGLPSPAPATDASVAPQKCEKEFKTSNNGNTLGKGEKEKAGKTPEIKICLRSVKENKGCTLNIANLLTPKISHNSANTFRAAGENAKCNVPSASDKTPSFTVRDIRDTKCKFQTPIYHVRDVRKLVKSSYRFVSLDNSDAKCSTAAAADKPEEKVTKEPVKQSLPSPIVIKCHSVKTNTKQQQTGEKQEKEAGPPSGPTQGKKQPHSEQTETQSHPETKPNAKQRQDKFAGEAAAERRSEPAVPKQAALEKLRAAVKTMEQLYVFDRNEWKRKTQAPQPVTDSHVLSLIAREEQGGEELTEPASTQSVQEDRAAMNIIHVPYGNDTGKTFSNKSVVHLGNKARVSISSVNNNSNSVPQISGPQTPSSLSSRKTSNVAPLSVKIQPPKRNGQVEQGKVKIIAANPTAAQDSENYLTIPGLGYASEVRVLNREPGSLEAKTPEQQRSPLIMEYPVSSSFYHHAAGLAGAGPQQPVLCFSPVVPGASPTPSAAAGETAPQTQRKMLLDPATGHYYLVDTPVQPSTKRLFDPETGRYVDVPVSHSPVSPVPLSLSPLAVSPGAYPAPAYMIYPGFIPSPTLPAQVVLPQSPCHSEDAVGEKVKARGRQAGASPLGGGGEGPYYSATAEAPHGPMQLPVSLGHVSARGGGGAGSDRKPVISITTQQGPRIIAPPSFDGTTMSFVVEHR